VDVAKRIFRFAGKFLMAAVWAALVLVAIVVVLFVGGALLDNSIYGR
jgi:hypothetical protein